MGGKRGLAIAFFVILGAAAFASPSIFFVQPAGEHSQENYAFLNVSVSGIVDTFKLNWNGTNATVYSPELLGGWNLNGNGQDWSKYGNGGSLLDGNASNFDGNTPPAFVPGKFGQGLEFDGYDDYLNISTWSDSATELTIEAWVFKGASKNQDIFTKKWDGDDYGYKLRILANDLLELQLRNETNASGYLRSNSALLNNTWYHVAGTYDGAEMRLYINGVLDNSKPFGGGINPGTDIPVIGAYVGAREGVMAYVFNGTLDEVRAYSRAKSPGEIGLTYNSELGRYYLNKTGLSEGVYSYYAWANDSSGESQTGTRTLTVDWSPPYWLQTPQDQVLEYGSGFYYDLNASDNLGSLQYSVNDTRFKISPTGVLENDTLLALGTYDLKARVNDSAGNVNSADFRVAVQDTIPPSIAVQHPYGGQKFAALGIPLNFTVWDLGGVSACKYELWNSSGAYNISLPGCLNSTMAGVTDGANSVRVWAGDASNNWNASPPVSFDIDTTRPRVSIQNPQAVVYTSKTIFLNFTAEDSSGISWCWYSLDGWASNVSLPSCQNTTILASEGTNTLRLAANDTFGNLNNSAHVSFSVDSTAPAWVEIPADRTIEYGDAFYYKVNATDANGLGKYSVNDSANFKINAATGEIENNTFLGIGIYSLRVGVNDTYGNANTSTFNVTVQDTTPPLVSIQSPQGINYTSKAISLNYTTWDLGGISSCKYELDGMNYSLPDCQNLTIAASENVNLLKVWANDSAGNWNYAEVSFTVDTTPPSFSSEQINETAFNGSRTVKFTFGVLDAYGVSSCWAELVLEDGSGTNISGSMDFDICTLTGTISQIGDFSFKPYANDTHGNVGNGTMQSGIRILLEWGPYKQDESEITVAGGTAYVTQPLYANNTRGSLPASNIPTGVQARAGWSCTEQTSTVSIPAGAYLELYANNCSNTSIITKNEGAWGSVIATESNQNISSSLNGTNTDPLVSYSNVYWSTTNESSACWSSQQVSGSFDIPASGSWSAAANMGGDCISESAWSNFSVYGTPSEAVQNITKSRTVSNLADLTFYNVSWSTTNDSSACWSQQTPTSGTYDLSSYLVQSVNMSGDCVNESLWAAAGVKGAPSVTSQTINATRTITSLDGDYAFTIGWSHDPDGNACWTGGTTTGTYTLAASTTIEANRTGDCVIEENADRWRQDTTYTTLVNGTAYVTSNFTIKNLASYNFNNLDLSQNITNRTGWSCPEKIETLNLTGNAELVYAQAINCTKENVVVTTAGGNNDWVQDTGKTTTAGGNAYILGNIKAANLDTLNYTNVQFPADLGDQARSGWACTQAGRTIGYINPTSTWESLDSPINCTKSGVINKIEGGWAVTQATEGNQNISRQLNGFNFDTSITYTNVLWSTSNDTSPCWTSQQTSGTIAINPSGSWYATANMSGDCIEEGSWGSVQVKENPTVTQQTIFTNRTASNLDTGYNFTNVAWAYDPDTNACWSGGNIFGYYNLTGTATIEANRTGDCVLEENADNWRQDTTKTTVVNGSAYVTSNYTIKNLAVYDFPNLDLTQNVTNRTGWSCTEKISSLNLASNAGLYYAQAINCTREKVFTKTLAHKKAYNGSVLVGEPLYAFYNFTVENSDTLPYSNVFANYTKDVNHTEWGNTSTEEEYLDLSGSASINRIVNVSNITVLEEWGDCEITQYGDYRKHYCTANLSVLEDELTRGLPIKYGIGLPKLYWWEWRDGALTTNLVDGSSAGVNRTEGAGGVNITVNTSHSGAYSLALGTHPFELVFYTYPPTPEYKPPTDNGSAMVNRNYTFVNVSSTQELSSCLLEWNGTNGSASAIGTECSINKTELLDGWYSYKVWVNNTVGNWKDTPLRTILIDTTPPIVDVAYPAGWRNTLSLVKNESDAESGIVECRLEYKNSTVSPESFGVWILARDDAAPCPVDSVLAGYMNSIASNNRSYQFRYSAKNGAGTWAYANITNATKLDNTAPIISYFTYTDGWQNETLTIAIGKYAYDPDSGISECVLQYKNLSVFNNAVQGDFDALEWVNVSSPDDCALSTFSGVNGMAYKFRYNVKNNAGNWSGWAELGNVARLDITPPEFVNVTYPEKWYNDTIRVPFALWGNDSQSGILDCDLQYRNATMYNGAVKGGVWSQWASVGAEGGDCGASHIDGVRGGAYQFRYRLKDNANLWSGFSGNGNKSMVDTSPPTGAVYYLSGWQTSLPVGISTVEYDNESGIAEYYLDVRSNRTSDGSFGNFDLIPWSLLSASPPPYSFSGTQGYAYQFRYRVKNNAGRWNSFEGDPGFVVEIDTTPPLLGLSYPNRWQTDLIIPLNISSADPESGILYCNLSYRNSTLVEGRTDFWSSWTETSGNDCLRTLFGAQDGQAYRFRLNVTNNAGSTNETVGTNVTYVDSTNPLGVGVFYPDGWRTSTSLSIGTSGRDPESGISDCDLEYNRTQLDHGGFTGWSGWVEYGSDWGDCPSFENASGTQALGLSNGYAYRFRFRVRNKVGVASSYYESANITKIDTTPPTLSFDYAQGWRNSLPFLFTSKIQDDPESGIAYCNLSFKNITLAGGSPPPGWDSGLPWVQTTGDDCALASFSALNGNSVDGQGLRLKYNATNNAGLTNESSPAKEAWIDTSPPAITLSYPTGWNTTGNVAIIIIKTDPQSGIDAASCTLFEKTAAVQSSNGVSEGVPQGWSGWSSLGTYCNSYSSARGTGAYQYNFSVKNNAGLYSSRTDGGVYKIDTSPPQGLSFDYVTSCSACWTGPDGKVWKTDNELVTLIKTGYDYDSGIECDLKYQYGAASNGIITYDPAWRNAGGSAWGWNCNRNVFNASASADGSGAGGYIFNYTIRNWAGTQLGYIKPNKEIRLEFTPPVVTFTYPYWTNYSTTIPLTHTESDPESGVPSTYCNLYYKSTGLSGKYGNSTYHDATAWNTPWALRESNNCVFTGFSGADDSAYKFNFSARNGAGLITTVYSTQNANDFAGIDRSAPNTPNDILQDIAYSSAQNLASGWQTSQTGIKINWDGGDYQSGVGECDLEYDRTKLDKGSFTAWSGWQKAGGNLGGECTPPPINPYDSADSFTYDAGFSEMNGYAYKLRLKVKNKADKWYSSYSEPGNIVKVDLTPPDIAFSYRTGWINTSGDAAGFSISHAEDDNQSGLLSCNLSYEKAPLEFGNGNGNWAKTTAGTLSTACPPTNPFFPFAPTGLGNKYAYKFTYTVSNKIYPETATNTRTAIPLGEVKVDITNATGVRIYYPAASSQNGWWNVSMSIPIVRTGDDLESGIADCDLEYQEAPMSWGVTGDFSAWTDDGSCVDSFTARNGHAYKFRYRVKNGASLWTDYTYNQDDNITHVDVTKPNTTATIRGETPNIGGGVLPSGWYNESRELTLTANDAESGPKYTFYSIDGQPYNVYTSPLQILEEIHAYSFYATNNAGLKEDTQTITIKKDTTKPAINRVRADLESVEKGWNTPIRVSANITDFAGISYANVCRTAADCNGVPANRWCSMAQAGGVWSCSIPTDGLALGNYGYYVSASDINYWYTVSEKRKFKVRQTELYINDSSGQPIDMQSTGTIIVDYTEYDGTNRTHIPKAACTLSGDFTGAMVDTGAYYAKIVKPSKRDWHIYTVSCAKEGYRTMPPLGDIMEGRVAGEDIIVPTEFSNDPLDLNADNKINAYPTILGPQGKRVDDTNARTASYTLSSKEGDFLTGNMRWDGVRWYATFLPDFGNYTAVVHFEDSNGIEGTGIVNAVTYGALGISTDAPALISIDLGSSSVARVYVNNSGKKERYYNLTIAGDLNLVSLDGVRLSGNSATITQLVGNKTTKTHYVEVAGRMITRQPESLSVQATNLKSARDSASLNITYQVTNKPVYGVRVVPDLDAVSIAMLLLIGLAYLSRRK